MGGIVVRKEDTAGRKSFDEILQELGEFGPVAKALRDALRPYFEDWRVHFVCMDVAELVRSQGGKKPGHTRSTLEAAVRRASNGHAESAEMLISKMICNERRGRIADRRY
jgi:hypothetical protein